MTIVLLSADLMAAARLGGVAQRRGLTVRTAANAQQALDHLAEANRAVVFIDLSTASLDLRAFVDQLKALPGDTARVLIAYGPHVHTALLAAARDAGCDRVLSRGQFLEGLDSLVAEFAQESQ